MVTLYGIKNCEPLRRLAVGWKLITSTIVFMIPRRWIGQRIIERFYQRIRLEALLNTRGTTWRKLDETTRKKSPMRPLRRH